MPLRVADVMTPNGLVVNPGDTVVRAAALMRDQDIGALPVGENDRLVGMITDRDIVTRTSAHGLAPESARARGRGRNVGGNRQPLAAARVKGPKGEPERRASRDNLLQDKTA